MIVFAPLARDHPLVRHEDKCAVCHQRFHAGQRVVLIPVPHVDPTDCVAKAIPCHAQCVLYQQDAPNDMGVIHRIKDGDASPFPVEVLKDGEIKQYKFQELGIDGL